MYSCKMLLEEYCAEAYSKDQYVHKLRQLKKEYKQTKASLTGPQSPVMKHHQVVSDEEDFDIYDTIPSFDF